MTPAQLSGLYSGFAFLENPYDLLLAEPLSFHLVLLSLRGVHPMRVQVPPPAPQSLPSFLA
jgi:hypothetical protein